jgi:hypothetical protein
MCPLREGQTKAPFDPEFGASPRRGCMIEWEGRMEARAEGGTMWKTMRFACEEAGSAQPWTGRPVPGGA